MTAALILLGILGILICALCAIAIFGTPPLEDRPECKRDVDPMTGRPQ